MALTEICLRRLGMTSKAVKFQKKILKEMTHFIMTKKGVLKEGWNYRMEFKKLGVDKEQGGHQ